MVCEYKIVVLGPYASGKTSILQRMTENTFDEYVQPTIGACYRQIRVQNKPDVRISVWDTAGNTRFHAILNMYTRNATIALLCWPYDERFSRDQINDFIGLCEENTQIIIVVTKTDKNDSLITHSEQIEQWSSRHERTMPIVYTSAKTGKGLDKLLATVHKIIDTSRPIHKETSIIQVEKRPSSSKCFNFF